MKPNNLDTLARLFAARFIRRFNAGFGGGISAVPQSRGGRPENWAPSVEGASFRILSGADCEEITAEYLSAFGESYALRQVGVSDAQMVRDALRLAGSRARRWLYTGVTEHLGDLALHDLIPREGGSASLCMGAGLRSSSERFERRLVIGRTKGGRAKARPLLKADYLRADVADMYRAKADSLRAYWRASGSQRARQSLARDLWLLREARRAWHRGGVHPSLCDAADDSGISGEASTGRLCKRLYDLRQRVAKGRALIEQRGRQSFNLRSFWETLRLPATGAGAGAGDSLANPVLPTAFEARAVLPAPSPRVVIHRAADLSALAGTVQRGGLLGVNPNTGRYAFWIPGRGLQFGGRGDCPPVPVVAPRVSRADESAAVAAIRAESAAAAVHARRIASARRLAAEGWGAPGVASRADMVASKRWARRAGLSASQCLAFIAGVSLLVQRANSGRWSPLCAAALNS